MDIVPFQNAFGSAAQQHYVIDTLLDKQQSVVLCGGEAATLLAAQLACDVSNQKAALEMFATASEDNEGNVLFIVRDKREFLAAQPLARRIQKTPKARLVVVDRLGDELHLTAKVNAERPALIVVGRDAVSSECLRQLTRYTSVIALSGGDTTGLGIADVWTLYSQEGFYWLKAKSANKLLKLTLENGFILEDVCPIPAAQGPVWSTAKPTIGKNSPAIGRGINLLSGAEHSGLILIPQPPQP